MVDVPRAEELVKIVEQMSDELLTMINDPKLDFTYASALGVVGELHSRVLAEAGETEEQKMEVLLHWMQFHLTRIFPNDDIELMIGNILSDTDLLDASVDATTKGH